MPNDDPFAVAHSLKSELYSRYASELDGHRAASASYARLAVQSAFILNGGALLAIPAYIAALREQGTNVPSPITTAFVLFVLGVISAALCAYAAYANYDVHASLLENERDTGVLQIDEVYDTDSYFRMRKPREQYRSEIKSEDVKLKKAANWTLLLSHIFGWSSYVLFCVGCYYATQAILG